MRTFTLPAGLAVTDRLILVIIRPGGEPTKYDIGIPCQYEIVTSRGRSITCKKVGLTDPKATLFRAYTAAPDAPLTLMRPRKEKAPEPREP